MTSVDASDFDWSAAVRNFSRSVKALEALYGRGRRYRTPFHNREVGGRMWSQHQVPGGGTAEDFDLTPEQAPDFVRRAWAAGLIPADETVKTQGTGPHGHVQGLPKDYYGISKWELAPHAITPFEETP